MTTEQYELEMAGATAEERVQAAELIAEEDVPARHANPCRPGSLEWVAYEFAHARESRAFNRALRYEGMLEATGPEN